jgi:hypothetical protein
MDKENQGTKNNSEGTTVTPNNDPRCPLTVIATEWECDKYLADSCDSDTSICWEALREFEQAQNNCKF